MRLALALAAAVALLVGALPASAGAPDTKAMVLHLSDLPTGFGLDKGGYVNNAAAASQSSVRKDFAKLGRIAGYDASFSRRALTGLISLSTSASLYKASSGAHESFLISVAAASQHKLKRLAVGAPLGAESRLYVYTVKQGGLKVDVYSVAWRRGKVLSSVFGGGISGTVDPSIVVRLAQKQDSKIVRAL